MNKCIDHYILEKAIVVALFFACFGLLDSSPECPDQSIKYKKN